MIQMSFFSENLLFIIAIIAAGCILIGRIWSNFLNWGEITDPQQIIKKGEEYRVVNLYLPKGWTEGWELGSIVCLECFHHRFFSKKRREIYVSGDRMRFTDEGPVIGSFYKASFTHASSGSIVMTHINKAGTSKNFSRVDWSKIK